ncbi:cytochrome c [Flavobacterium ovatum]|uniref:c-type cytochrome n=1 Tax=Flavobacterium ovatum TaxID=1928857 RepID=UPI00344FA3FE
MHFIITLLLSTYIYLPGQFMIIHSDLKKDYSLITGPQQKNNPLQESIQRGQGIYTDFCIQCHLINGKGDSKNFPPLDGSDWFQNKRLQSIHAVKYGQSGAIIVNQKKYNNSMPAMGLSNQEIADVMNYIMNSWSNKQRKMVIAEEVESIKFQK